jgi:hypothetical protein
VLRSAADVEPEVVQLHAGGLVERDDVLVATEHGPLVPHAAIVRPTDAG